MGLLERDTAGVAAGLEMCCAISVGLDSPQNYLQIVSPPPPTSIRLPRASCRPQGNSADISTFQARLWFETFSLGDVSHSANMEEFLQPSKKHHTFAALADFVTRLLLLLLFRCASYLVCSQAGFYAERFPTVGGGQVRGSCCLCFLDCRSRKG